MAKRILEVGCGQGYNTFLLSKNNKVIGIDISKGDIAISIQRYPNVDFRVMDAGRMEFKNNYFDEVYAMDILEHVDNLGEVIKEVRRVLKNHGIFKVNIPYYKSESWLLKIRPTYFKEIHHVRVFKENELDNLLKKEGFSISKKQKKGFLQHIELYFLFKRNINSKTQLSIGSWRDNIFTKFVHVSLAYCEPFIVKTPLVYFPLWIITIPIGTIINFFGNRFFPKSYYYEFIKK